jgi:hypothetical protein
MLAGEEAVAFALAAVRPANPAPTTAIRAVAARPASGSAEARAMPVAPRKTVRRPIAADPGWFLARSDCSAAARSRDRFRSMFSNGVRAMATSLPDLIFFDLKDVACGQAIRLHRQSGLQPPVIRNVFWFTLGNSNPICPPRGPSSDSRAGMGRSS